MDVDAVFGVVVGGDSDGIPGISGIRDDRIGIRAEKIGLIGDKAPDRQPDMKGLTDVQRVPYQDPPDPDMGFSKRIKINWLPALTSAIWV